MVPDLDPCDGGTDARLLLLLEKPGPGAGRRDGDAGFVSFDNPSPTARAGRAFLREAGVPRGGVAIWNAVPWWNGTTRLTAAERRAGLDALDPFLALLPQLAAAVTVGRTAAAAGNRLAARGLAVFASAHPSPQVRAARPELWRAIPAVWREAAAAAGLREEACIGEGRGLSRAWR
jgi:uracil-DNA glycosylase